MIEAAASHERSTDEVPDMLQLLGTIARSLVDAPELVSVESLPQADVTVLQLRVQPDDIGKIIGRQGRTARSLRTILGAASMKLKHRYSLDIIESESETSPS